MRQGSSLWISPLWSLRFFCGAFTVENQTRISLWNWTRAGGGNLWALQLSCDSIAEIAHVIQILYQYASSHFRVSAWWIVFENPHTSPGTKMKGKRFIKLFFTCILFSLHADSIFCFISNEWRHGVTVFSTIASKNTQRSGVWSPRPSVWSVHVLPVSTWLRSWSHCFLQKSKNRHSGNSELAVGVSASVNGCFLHVALQ